MKKYQLIKLYPNSPDLGTILTESNAISFEDYSEFWKEIISEEYKILSFKQKSGIEDLWTEFYHGRWCRNVDGRAVTSAYTTKEMLDNNLYFIHSVKRLSDGEIFTIGDNAKWRDYKEPFKIATIRLPSTGNVCIDLERNNQTAALVYLHEIKKLKPYLFTTEDGVDIYEGDRYYYTYNWNITEKTAISGTYLTKRNYYFSSREAAEKYIKHNKPILSYKDIEMSTIYSSYHGYILNMGKLRDIVKKRMK